MLGVVLFFKQGLVKLTGKFNGHRNAFYSDVFRLELLRDLFLMVLGRGTNKTQSVFVSNARVLFFRMSSIKTGHFFALVIVVLQLVQLEN